MAISVSTSPHSSKAMASAVFGLSAVNIAGVIGLSWLAAGMLGTDVLMVFELGICAALIALLMAFTIGGLALRHRGKEVAAVALPAVVALPTLAVYGFLLYLDSHPIDMR